MNNEDFVLIALAERYYNGKDMERVTHEDLNMDLDEFNKALRGLIQKGYLPNGGIANNPSGRDVYFAGNELSDRAKEIIDGYLQR